jgi:predicted GNAT superfamily acetyltransferase
MSIEFEALSAPLPPALVDEIAALCVQVFGTSTLDVAWRLSRMPEASVFCAREAGRLVGFKAGYATAERIYQSWLGAVLPQARRRGIATRLADLQHAWLAERGYASVETSCRQGNDAMARVNLASGFAIVGTRLDPHGLQVLWRKPLS